MRVGIAGFGFMGWIHYLAYQASEQAELVAYCTRDAKKKQGDFSGIQGNFGPPGRQEDVSHCSVYDTLAEMLTDDSIDVIDICLPPSMHEAAIDAAIKAGKSCLCEKPLALDYATAKRLADLAGQQKLMVAHILPLMNEFQFVFEAFQDQRYGSPVSGRFKRTIAPPDWIPDFYESNSVGGPLIDLHVHDAHFIRMLFGMPTAAHTVCTRKNGLPKAYETVFEFAQPERIVSSGGGVIDSPARPFTHGFEIGFEKATLQFEFAAYSDETTALIPLVVLHNDGRIEKPELGNPDPIQAFVREVNLAAVSFHDADQSAILDPHIAADAIKICEMQTT